MQLPEHLAELPVPIPQEGLSVYRAAATDWWCLLQRVSTRFEEKPRLRITICISPVWVVKQLKQLSQTDWSLQLRGHWLVQATVTQPGLSRCWNSILQAVSKCRGRRDQCRGLQKLIGEIMGAII